MPKPDDKENIDPLGSQGCTTQEDTPESQEASFKLAVLRVKELIMYAAETGKEIEGTTRLSILEFSQKVIDKEKWTTAEEDKFWEATSALSKELYPVTHTTLKASKKNEYGRRGVYLFVPITALLLVTLFWLQSVWVILNNVTTSIDENIKSRDSADLVLKESEFRVGLLEEKLQRKDLSKEEEGSVLKSIESEKTKQSETEQIKTTSISELKSSTLILEKWVLFKWLLTSARPPSPGLFDGKEEKERKRQEIGTWEEKKAEKKEFWDKTLYIWAKQVIYGLSAYVLPLICALLGSCAYILRSMLNKIKNLTYSKELIIQYLLRLVLGALAGISIGWFFKPESTNLGLVTSISPLALAFLAGYSVELLFTAMDKIISTFTETELSRKS